jgi:hypothetical protein
MQTDRLIAPLQAKSSLVFPYNFYQFRLVTKIIAFTVALTSDTATGCTHIVALVIYHLIVLVAAVAAEQKNPFPVVAVFCYLGRRVPLWLLSDCVNSCLDAGRKNRLFSFAALLPAHTEQNNSRK